MDIDKNLADELKILIRRFIEKGSNNPDFVLAEYMFHCLDTFDLVIRRIGQKKEEERIDKGCEHDWNIRPNGCDPKFCLKCGYEIK